MGSVLTLDLDIDNLLRVLKEFGEKRKWYLKYAKFNWRIHDSLLSHCLNVAALSFSILDSLGEFHYVQVTDKLRIQVLLTGFLHDAGKETNRSQAAVEVWLTCKGSEPLDHCHQDEVTLQAIVRDLQKVMETDFPIANSFPSIWDETVWSITQLGRRENAGAISHSFKKAPSSDALTCREVVHLADVMMSQQTVEDAAKVHPGGTIVSNLHLAYSKVSIVRGILTQFLHAALDDEFSVKGFRAVQWFPNGTVYLGKIDAKIPIIDEKKIIDSIVKKIRNVLDKNRTSQMAKAAFGVLTFQVIASPEFLFASDQIIHEFWQYLARQKFATPIRKELNDLKDTEKKLYRLISNELKGKDESTKLTYLGRFLADFNLLIVLYAARKELVENSKSSNANWKKIGKDATENIQGCLAQFLKIPLKSLDAWPEIAVQTKAEERFPVVTTLWQSRYYENLHIWQKELLKTLEKATIELAKMWREHIPDKYGAIAQHLVSDITSPVNPQAILHEVEELNSVIEKGKLGHGTPTCQRCGGVACFEAQAKLFGESEIYNDNLIAGYRVGGGNKIRVCEVCDFEEKLRTVFVPRWQKAFFILPHLALSRRQQIDWQNIANRVRYNAGEFPPLWRVVRWAERAIGGKISSLPSVGPTDFSPNFSDKELGNAIQNVADAEAFTVDLSSMIEPPLDAKDGRTVATLIREGKCKLKEKCEKKVLDALNQMDPVYLSPNYVVLLIGRTPIDKDEPESSAAIKWTFFQCVLARLFSATVLPADSFNVMEDATLGYTKVPSHIVLKTLAEKLNARKGWIPIPELERTMTKLSGLILTSQQLFDAKADYGNSTLLRLLHEESGRVLVRMNRKGGVQAYPRRLISFLDAWNTGEPSIMMDGVKNA